MPAPVAMLLNMMIDTEATEHGQPRWRFRSGAGGHVRASRP